MLKKIERPGFNTTHVYGLTEVYGPAIVCEWQQQWRNHDQDKIAPLKARQGVNYPGLKAVNVFKSQANDPVIADGTDLGEVCMQGKYASLQSAQVGDF